MRRNSSKHNRASHVFEYLVLVCVIMAIFVAMGVYVRQGMQGQVYKAGEVFGYGRQAQ